MAKISKDFSQTGITPRNKPGVDLYHQRRRMKTYTVTELELNTVSSLNTGCSFGIGMSTLFFGAGIGFVAARVTIDMDKALPEAKVLLGFPGMALVFGLSAGFAVYAFICYKCSGGMIDTIKRESEDDIQT
jgi:hypothetical protein